MKYLGLTLFFATLFSALQGQYQFTPIYDLPCTTIKSQDRTGTCWSYATSSLIESEHLKVGGKSIDLSEMFVVRKIYLDKARNYLLRQGKANFSQGSLSHDMLRVFNEFGVMPEEAYSGLTDGMTKHNHSEMEKALKGYLDGVLNEKAISDKWPDAVNALLDVYLGPCQEKFIYEGITYTPKTFAEKLNLVDQEYISITSFNHHPYYKEFVLEIPDNYSNGQYFNVRLDELVESIDYALSKGYSISWDGDVSEITFSAGHGIAILPAEDISKEWYQSKHDEIEVNQENRQNNFENFSTTDDHLMHIVGSAKDQDGIKYYKVKNSWGERGPYDGYVYMSTAYLKMKTISITANKAALPATIINKLQL